MGSDLRDLRTGEREWSDESYRIFGVTREDFDFVPTQENVFRAPNPLSGPNPPKPSWPNSNAAL
jgi:hypothetical protein